MNNICLHEWSDFNYTPVDSEIGKDWRFGKCNKCGVVSTLKFGSGVRQRLYGRDYYIREYETGWFTTDAVPKTNGWINSRMGAIKLAGLDIPHGNKNILQINAGMGPMNIDLLLWGWNVYCCDVNPWATKYTMYAHPHVISINADWLEWRPNIKFDAIVLNHVLHHMEYADLALLKIYSLLEQDGKVYIEVPAVLSKNYEINEQFWPSKYEISLNASDVYWNFTEDSLKNWMESASFKNIQFVNTGWDGVDVDYHCVAVKNESN